MKRCSNHPITLSPCHLVTLLALLLLPCPAGAQFGGPQVTGVIVDIRGDILQIRPRYSTKLTRALLDERSVIRKPRMLDLSSVQVGTRLMAMGDYQSPTELQARFLMVVSDADGWFGRKTAGVFGTGYGKSAMAGGVVKSLRPFVLIGAEGKEMTITVPPSVAVMRQEPSSREALLVGQTVRILGEKTADELMHVRTLEIQEAPGGGGTLFGVIKAVHGQNMELLPRFSEETVQVQVASSTKIQRQRTIDPRTVKIGDTLTAQGRLADDKSGRLVASVLLLGEQSYPYTRPTGFFATFRGVGDATQLRTGKVTALFPLTLKLKQGGSVRVTVPGQTPIVDLLPASQGDIRVGEKIMVIGTEGKEGAMVAATIILGASPIAGFGN